jgi:DNA-binding LacI/PurR family transcriptional regulator
MNDNEQNPKKVTQDDVAKSAGVTRSLVSYVLNDSNRTVAPETREKILKAIDELGYRPNKFAQGLMRGSSNNLAGKQIGIVMNKAEVFLRPYYGEILEGIHLAAHDQSYHIRFIRFFDDLKNPVLFNELIHDEEICGLILISLDQSISTPEDSHVIAKIMERIKNIVCVEWQQEGLPSVHFDRQGASYKATSYLLKNGYKSLAYIGQSDNRILGFKQALLENNIDNINAIPILYGSDMEDGFTAIKSILSRPGKIDAVVAGSDEVAMGILRYLNKNKIDIPSQIALISMDNIKIAEFTSPPLTTINVQKGAMGKYAVDLIIRNRGLDSIDSIGVTLPTELIIRESC